MLSEDESEAARKELGCQATEQQPVGQPTLYGDSRVFFAGLHVIMEKKMETLI